MLKISFRPPRSSFSTRLETLDTTSAQIPGLNLLETVHLFKVSVHGKLLRNDLRTNS